MKSPKTRRLVAIMFTDIVGYTALMQRDEQQAAKVRAIHRKVFDEQHQVHQGEILQYFGDGTLSVFQSGVKAVECALEIQLALNGEEPVPIRIGLHIGDVVFDGTEIYGDGVNLAARIESMGVAGGILLSAKLNDELKNQPEISTLSLGSFELKNITHPVEVFSVSNGGIKIPKISELKGAKQAIRSKSIAVLPFVNMSASQDNEYFSDGITEEITNALSKIHNLKVTSRTSSFLFKNKQLSIPEIGRELKVSTILEGSIRLSGNMMRITAQLINVSDDFHFWSQTFDRSTENIFAVQDEISLLIADKLREHLGHLEIEDQLVETHEIPLEVYKKYLKGRYHVLKLNLEDIQIGQSILKEVIEEQADFPLAYLTIHHGYAFLGAIGMLPAHEAFAKGKFYLDKAIALDENLPECQFQMAGISFWQNWDLKAAYRNLNKAIELRPAYSEAIQTLAATLAMEGKFEAAEHYVNRAIELDPFSPIYHYIKGLVFYLQEDYSRAIPHFLKSLELDNHFIISIFIWGMSLVLSGKEKESLALFQKLPDEGPSNIWKLGGLAVTYAALGEVQKAEGEIAKLEASMATDVMGRALHFIILSKTEMGRLEEAMQHLEQSVSFHLPVILFLHKEPLVKALRDIPRFNEINRQIWEKEDVPDPLQEHAPSSALRPEELNKYAQKLGQYISVQKPYLEPQLSLRDLAGRLEMPPNHLSHLLQERFGKSFSDFINGFRLKAFISRAKDPANQHRSLWELARESGFDSEAVFLAYFEQEVGMLPEEWVMVDG